MSTYLALTLFLTLVTHGLSYRVVQYDTALNETGRYLYQDPKKPASSLICSYCALSSLTTEDKIQRDQEERCIDVNLPKSQSNLSVDEIQKLALCKEDGTRQRPGCGDLSYPENLKTWKVVLSEGGEERISSNTSIVYHVYRPICKEEYNLVSARTYRCGENLQWNNSDPARCVLKGDPSSTPISNSTSNSSVTIAIGVALSILLIVISVVLIISYRKGWLPCFCEVKYSKEGSLTKLNPNIGPALAIIESECNKSVTSDHTEHTVLSEDSHQTRSVRRQNRTDSGICEVADKKLIPTKNNDPNDLVTVFGACRIPDDDGQIPSFCVFQGCDIYPLTRVKLKKTGQFILELKEDSTLCSAHSNLKRKYNFLYVISDVTVSDSGIYNWTVVDHKKKQYRGSFSLKVTEAQVDGVSSDVYAIPATEGEIEPQKENQIQTSREQAPPPLLKDIGVVTCTLTLEQATDDPKFYNVIQKLCYHLDPLHNGRRCERWPGLITFFLGEKISRAYISAIEYHKRGNPDDGPTAFVLPQLCSEGYSIGHIVWYFTRPGQLYQDVVNMLVKCHSCPYCQDIYNSTKYRTAAS